MVRKEKKPKTTVQPPWKSVRVPASPEDANQLGPVWSISIFDADGQWGRERCNEGESLWEHIFPKLRDYETMTWNAILQNKKHNHDVEIGKLIKQHRTVLQNSTLMIWMRCSAFG